MAKPKEIKTEHTQSRFFSYKQGDCKLTFTLRVDNKDELKDFVPLLEQALVDVKAEIEKPL